jgi:hypothetical protein
MKKKGRGREPKDPKPDGVRYLAYTEPTNLSIKTE